VKASHPQHTSSLIIPIVAGVVVVAVIVGAIISIESQRPTMAVAPGDISVPVVTVVAQPTSSIPYPSVPRISIEETRKKLEAGQAVLVDVRNKYAYDQAHLPGSLFLPEEEIASRKDELPRNKEVILYCA
jgi:3-mercaptopyruvate sulfurtransferase SseA